MGEWPRARALFSLQHRARPHMPHIRIFTNKLASCASAMAHELPAMPTQMPEPKLVRPTLRPDQKIEYAAKRAAFRYAASCGPPCGITSGSFIFPERMMARMMP